jgi:hypothetical protein
MPPRFLKREIELRFPHLKRSDYFVTSEEDGGYNCFAFAVHEMSVHWYPTEEEEEGVYWPPGVERTESLEAFIEAFKTKGYLPCEDDNSDLEPGCEKIAIYLGDDNKPCHAARQLSSGAWTSKLGVLEDIEHKTLTSLESTDFMKPAYWKIGKVLRKQLPLVMG